MRFVAMATVTCFVLATTSCATILGGSNDSVEVSSSPSGALVRVDGNKVGRTPISLDLSRKTGHIITAKKDGKEGTCKIGRTIDESWLVLDFLILPWLILPWLIDAITGAWTRLDKDRCHIHLTATSKATY